MIPEWINSHPSLYILPQTDSTVLLDQLMDKKTSTEPNRSGSPRLTLTINSTSAGRLRYPVRATLLYDVAPDAFNGKSITFLNFNRRQDEFKLYLGENKKVFT
jgi:hypothetical protein